MSRTHFSHTKHSSWRPDSKGPDSGWWLLGHLTAAQLAVNYAVNTTGALAPFIQTLFGISRAELGLWTTARIVGLLSASPFVGVTVDRREVRRSLLIGLGISGGGTALVSLATSPLHGMACMFLVGIGFIFITPATTKAIMSWFKPHVRATAMGVKQAGVPLGGVAAAALLPSVAVALGWRASFSIAGIMTALMGPVIWASLGHMAEVEAPSIDKVGGLRLWPALQGFLSDRSLVALAMIHGIFAGTQYSIGTHFVLFLREVLGMPVVTAGLGLATVQAAGVLGRVLWGIWSDFHMRGQHKKTLTIVALVAMGGALTMGFMRPGVPPGVLFAMAFVLGLGAYGWAGQLLVLRSELVAEEVGLITSLSFGLSAWGTLLGPPLFGLMVDMARSYQVAWFVLTGSLAMVVALLTLVRDPEDPHLSDTSNHGVSP